MTARQDFLTLMSDFNVSVKCGPTNVVPDRDSLNSFLVQSSLSVTIPVKIRVSYCEELPIVEVPGILRVYQRYQNDDETFSVYCEGGDGDGTQITNDLVSDQHGTHFRNIKDLLEGNIVRINDKFDKDFWTELTIRK